MDGFEVTVCVVAVCATVYGIVRLIVNKKGEE